MRCLFGLLLFASPLGSQTIVLVDAVPDVRRFLVAEWDSAGVEKAYCAAFTLTLGRESEPFLVLTAINHAVQRDATPEQVFFSCPRGLVPMHSHTNSLCGPSLRDIQFLGRTGALFGIVVCGPHHYVGFSSKLKWPKP